MNPQPHWRELIFSLGTRFWWLLLFLQPFNRFIAIKLLLLLLTAVAIALGRGPIVLSSRRLPTTAAVGALIVVWALLVSLLGPYPADSLEALRKEMLYQVVLFAAAWRFVNSGRDALRAVGAIAAGFAAVTAAAAIEVVGQWFATGITAWPGRSHDMLWGGYGAIAGMFLPLFIGWLVYQAGTRATRFLGWALAIVAVVLTVMYGSRTPLLVVTITVLMLLGLAHNWRVLRAIGILGIAAVMLLPSIDLGGFERYRTLLDSKTYVTNERNALWAGVADVIDERPWQGYGYGWKKLAWAVRDGGHVARWETRHATILNSFTPEVLTAYGKANPHNYVLQVAFEIGIVGLALVLAFWFLAARTAIQCYRRDDRDVAIFAALALTCLTAYALSNITNGHWVGGLANTAVALAGCLTALNGRYAARRNT